MRKRVVLAVVVATVAALFTAPAAEAVTYGEPDGGRHPFVGALLWDHDPTSPGIEAGCSGTLVSPTVFLTAAHCDPDFDRAGNRVVVSFDRDVAPVTAKTRLRAGRFVGHPDFARDPRGHDIAVVLLDRAVTGITPARLPRAGHLDRHRTDAYTVVGYGVTELQLYDGRRRSAVSGLLGVGPTMLHLSQNPLRGEGGTCGRDSGGPAFPGEGRNERHIVVALTHAGDLLCTYDGEYYRTDTPTARAFLSRFVTLP